MQSQCFLACVQAHFKWFGWEGVYLGRVCVQLQPVANCSSSMKGFVHSQPLPFGFPCRIEKRFKRLWLVGTDSQIKSLPSNTFSWSRAGEFSWQPRILLSQRKRPRVSWRQCLFADPTSLHLTSSHLASPLHCATRFSVVVSPTYIVCVQFVLMFTLAHDHYFDWSRPPQPRVPFHSCFSPGCHCLLFLNYLPNRVFQSDIFPLWFS